MEEKILKIISDSVSGYQLVNDDDPILIAGKESSAKEITSHVMEFIRWILFNGLYFVPFKISKSNELKFRDRDDNEYTIDELYTYWLKNEKK